MAEVIECPLCGVDHLQTTLARRDAERRQADHERRVAALRDRALSDARVATVAAANWPERNT